MPNPYQSDLHVNIPLTNVSIAYIPKAGDYIATSVFPKVPVQNQSNVYWKYSKSDWRRTDVQKRAPGTESAGTGWNLTTDSYFAQVYAVHKDVDDQTRANADSNFRLDSDATKFITNQLLLKRDLDWAAKYFVTGVWGTEYTGVAAAPGATQFLQWDQAGSDPINDVMGFAVTFRQNTGFMPNVMITGALVNKSLKNHPDIIDRIKYTQKGFVTEDLLASVFGVDKYLVGYAASGPSSQINDAVAQDAAATYSFINNPKAVLLAYVPSSPSLNTPSAGYTFTWNGYAAGNSEGIKVKSFRMEPIASDRVEAEMTYDMKIVCPDVGVFLNTVVA